MNFKAACNAVADLFEAVPKVWCRGGYAVNDRGEIVPPGEPSACKWCAAGGVVAAMGLWRGTEAPDALDVASRRLFGECLEYVNDHRGRKAAIKVLREAGK